jgi:stage II sporulation protein D
VLRTLSAAVLAAVAALTGSAAAAEPAQPELSGAPARAAAAASITVSETYPVPAGGVYQLRGHGWGHGHGMSQWGAQGAALAGVPASTILSTYYPNTAATVLPNSVIRVWLEADEGIEQQVVPASGLVVHDVSSNVRATLPPGPTRWRVMAVTGGLQVQWRHSTGPWYPWALAGRSLLAGPVRFGGPAVVGVVFPDDSVREYRGITETHRLSSGVRSTVRLTLEDYLLGVVPREVSASWAPAALQAQAVAARTYAAHRRAAVSSSSTYDICDTTSCQVFSGTRVRSASGYVTEYEHPATTAAIRATAGMIRTYGGRPAFTEFSSSNGGWSTNGGQPYLVAKADPWDGLSPANTMHSWAATLPAADVQRYYPQVGRLLRIKVLSRDGNGEWGGRVGTVVLEGVSSTGAPTSVTTTGERFRSFRPYGPYRDGVRSSWFTIV